ncbi:hypothetical protein ACOSQ2_009994 [Xanthoceras sorbifolium]
MPTIDLCYLPYQAPLLLQVLRVLHGENGLVFQDLSERGSPVHSHVTKQICRRTLEGFYIKRVCAPQEAWHLIFTVPEGVSSLTDPPDPLSAEHVHQFALELCLLPRSMALQPLVKGKLPRSALEWLIHEHYLARAERALNIV